MKEYILILTLSLTGQSDVAIGTAEFSNKAACDSAAKKWKLEINTDVDLRGYSRSDKIAIAQCLPKDLASAVPDEPLPKLKWEKLETN